MEIFTLLILAAVVIIVIKTGADVSYIKGQNNLLHQDIDMLREELRRISAGKVPAADDISELPIISNADPEAAFDNEKPPQWEETESEKALNDDCQKDLSEEADAPRPNNWEKLIGVNLFSKIGILVLIVGIGFFVKYAIDRDWINEVTRTVLGIDVGLALWAIAYRIRDSYRSFSSILAGGGFAICFTCIAIAFHLYSIFSAFTTLSLFVGLTIAMIAVSLRYDRLELAITSIVGAFAAPFIASDGGGSFLFVLAYVAVLDTAMFAVTMTKNWWSLPPLSCFLTYLVCTIGFFSGEPAENHHAWWLAAIAYYFILFSIPLTSAVFRNSKRSQVLFWSLSAIILNGLAYLCFGVYLVDSITTLPQAEGAIGLLGACINFGIYLKFYLKRKEGPGSNLLVVLIAAFALAGGLALFTDTGIWPAAAGIEAAALSWLHIRSGRRIYKRLALIIGLPLTALLLVYAFSGKFRLDFAWGYIVTGLAFAGSGCLAIGKQLREGVRPARILSTGALWAGCAIGIIGCYMVFDHYLSRPLALGTTLLLTASVMLLALTTIGRRGIWSLYLLLPGLCALLLALMGMPAPGKLIENIPLLAAMATIAGVYLICAADIFTGRSKLMTDIKLYTIYFHVAASIFAVIVVLYCLDMAGLQQLRSAGVSIALTACAATQMAIGMRHHNKLLRLVALCVFGIVIIKLGVYDIWKMVAIGRIIVFILLGIILLAVSFLYQRLRNALLNEKGGKRDIDINSET